MGSPGHQLIGESQSDQLPCVSRNVLPFWRRLVKGGTVPIYGTEHCKISHGRICEEKRRPDGRGTSVNYARYWSQALLRGAQSADKFVAYDRGGGWSSLRLPYK